MIKAVVIAVVLFLSVVTSAATNKCPDLSGEWICSLEINDFPESAVTMGYRNFQKDLKDGEVSYDVGGWEFTAKPDVETMKDSIRFVCKDGKLIIRFMSEGSGTEVLETLTRVSPVKMTAEILEPKNVNGNYKTFYACEKVGEGVPFALQE